MGVLTTQVNLAPYKGIRIPEYGKIFLVESGVLKICFVEAGIQEICVVESGIPVTIGIQNLSSTDKESGIQFLES